MFKKRTLFVLGAGASAEVGLPTGDRLKGKIAECLRPTKDAGLRLSLPHSDQALNHALLFASAGNSGLTKNDVLEACEAIANAMAGTGSIDTYIDIMAHVPAIAVCGKLAIASEILKAERASSIYVDPSNVYSRLDLNLPHLQDSQKPWHASLVQLIVDGSTGTDPARALELLSFIVFNYDRCLEHFLIQALEAVYRVEQTEATRLVDGLRIYHPYGTVGAMPGLRGGVKARYGEDYSRSRSLLKESASGIRTFTERHDDDGLLNAIHNEVATAEVIVFLGFGFNEQNIRLLTPGEQIDAKQIFATGRGLSGADVPHVKAQLQQALFPKILAAQSIINIHNDKSCAGLFRELWRTLPG